MLQGAIALCIFFNLSILWGKNQPNQGLLWQSIPSPMCFAPHVAMLLSEDCIQRMGKLSSEDKGQSTGDAHELPLNKTAIHQR
jgi:hypothetical protein